VKILEPEQAWRILIVAGQRRTGKTKSGKTISTDLVPYLAIGLFAGLRSSEIEGLDWSDINLQARQIQVRSSVAKTSMRRSVEISDNLYAWLKPYEQERGGFVFTGWRDRLQKLQKAAGFKKWPENALRHSFASYHYDKHKNIDLTMCQTGHEDKNTFHRHYKQLISTNDNTERYWNIFPQESWMKSDLPVRITAKQRKHFLDTADNHRATPFKGYTVLCTEDEDGSPDAAHGA
jgi:integrase